MAYYKSNRPVNPPDYDDDEVAYRPREGVGRTPDQVNYDLEGQEISLELFHWQAAVRANEEQARKEAEVAELVEQFIQLFDRLEEDGMVIYWEKDFQRTNSEPKKYRYAALHSDGLWWITGRHTSGRTTEAMITELIKMRQTDKTVTVAYMAQLLKDQS